MAAPPPIATISAIVALLWSVQVVAQTPTVQRAESPLRLDVRVFDGANEVTNETRVRLFKAGSRTDPETLRSAAGATASAEVAPGFYDLQAVRERDGRVVAIRWAEQRLVVRYPDEHGRHLEVVNLRPGFGALQVRRGSPPESGVPSWSASLHPAGENAKEAASPLKADGYLLFVAPSGHYDLKVMATGAAPVWMRDIELPADQTRLKTWE